MPFELSEPPGRSRPWVVLLVLVGVLALLALGGQVAAGGASADAGATGTPTAPEFTYPTAESVAAESDVSEPDVSESAAESVATGSGVGGTTAGADSNTATSTTAGRTGATDADERAGDGAADARIVVEESPSWSAAEPGFRSAFLVGVMVLLGAPLTLLFVVYPLARRDGLRPGLADRATLGLFGGALLAVALGAVGLALGQEPTPESLSLATVASYAGTGAGSSLLLRTGVVASLGLVTAVAVVRSDWVSRRGWLGAVTAGGLVLAVSISRTNHSTAAVERTAGVLVGFGHQVGAAIWVGGVAALALVVPVYLRRAEDPTPLAAALIRRFSVVAVAGVTVAGATGLAIASWHVPAAGSLGATVYGVVLVAKVLLVLVALGMGGVNRLVLGRHLQSSGDRSGGRNAVWAGPVALIALLPTHGSADGDVVRTFVRSVRLELVVLLLVLVLSGVLTSVPTAADVSASEAESTERQFDSRVTDRSLSVEVVPGQVGQNAFVVRVAENGSAVSAEGPVKLTVSRPDGDVALPGIEPERVGQGAYSTVASIPSAGPWEVLATARVGGTNVTERVTVSVTEQGATRTASREVTEAGLTDAGFGPFLRYGALAVAVVGAIAVAFELGQLLGRREGR